MNWNNIFEKALEKVAFTKSKLGGKFPHITKDGEWLTSDFGHWTGGFWTGLLWMDALNHPEKMDAALEQAKKLKGRLADNKTHDMGFIFGPSCIWGYHLTQDESLAEMAVQGARNLKHLYDPASNAIYAWDEPDYQGISIVDTMMNLPILIWAGQKSNDPDLTQIATRVADQIQKNHLRKDHSIYHVVHWDPKTHRILNRGTHQGFSKDSCWSRGQAWALYGFANMSRVCGKIEYLETAQNLAGYFWDHLDKNHLPKWDFVFQNSNSDPVDSSAGSIAASGMLLISELLKTTDQNQSQLWEKRAETMLESLTANCLYSQIDRYGILEKVTVDKPHNSGIGESSMYGDYYFVEALYRLLNKDHPEVLKKLY